MSSSTWFVVGIDGRPERRRGVQYNKYRRLNPLVEF